MITHPGYFPDLMDDQEVFRCATCKFDSFTETGAQKHVKNMHDPITLPELEVPIEEWIDRFSNFHQFSAHRVLFGFLTWNTEQASMFAADALAKESEFLGKVGIESRIFWVDNGSTDHTLDLVSTRFTGSPYNLVALGSNHGQSYARNLMIAKAKDWDADLLMFVDGDIEVIPHSSFAFLRYLHANIPEIGVIGMDSNNCSVLPDRFTSFDCRAITHELTKQTPQIAWTQYGMFRTSMFDSGIKFDATDAFYGPGWGLEDDDLYFQMLDKSYLSVNTPYFRYLHRPRNSSLKILGPDLVTKVFQARKDYMRMKWADHPNIMIRMRMYKIYNLTLPTLKT